MGLYNEKGDWTPEALEICDEIRGVLKPILEKSLVKSHSHSDFCYMVNNEMALLILENRRRNKKHK